MNFYNVQSIFLFFSLISLIGGLVALFSIKKLDTSARYWVAAALVLAATNSITLFRSTLPMLLSYSIAVGLSLAMFVVMGLGIARLYNKGPQAPALLGTLVLTVIYTLILEWSRVNAPAKVTLVLSSLGFALSAFWCAIPAHRHYQLTGNPFSRHMRWLVIALGLAQFVRLHSLLSDHWSIQNMDQSHLNLAVWTLIYVLSILRYCFYVAMRIQEKADDRAKAAIADARMQERQRTADQLAQLSRQHSLGIMAASVSHELNQPLTATLNYAELAKFQIQSGHAEPTLLIQLMDYIMEHTFRASQIIRQFRQFIKPTEATNERIEVNKLVAEVCELLDMEIRHHHVRVSLPLNESEVFVQGNRILLSQVLVNLMLNAVQAMEASTLRELHLAIQTDRQNVSILVRDTGTGLPKGYTERLGEPFFTTKAQGLGLGISICQNILSQFGGHLILENQTPQGVCAIVILPKAA